MRKRRGTRLLAACVSVGGGCEARSGSADGGTHVPPQHACVRHAWRTLEALLPLIVEPPVTVTEEEEVA